MITKNSKPMKINTPFSRERAITQNICPPESVNEAARVTFPNAGAGVEALAGDGLPRGWALAGVRPLAARGTSAAVSRVWRTRGPRLPQPRRNIAPDCSGDIPEHWRTRRRLTPDN